MKGKNNNPAGRPKGSVNTTTKEIRELFTKLLSDNLSGMQSDLQGLEPAQRLKTLLELAKFCVPTLRAIEVKTEEEEADNWRYDLMSKEELSFVAELGKKYNFKPQRKVDPEKMSDEDLIVVTDIMAKYENW